MTTILLVITILSSMCWDYIDASPVPNMDFFQKFMEGNFHNLQQPSPEGSETSQAEIEAKPLFEVPSWTFHFNFPFYNSAPVPIPSASSPDAYNPDENSAEFEFYPEDDGYEDEIPTTTVKHLKRTKLVKRRKTRATTESVAHNENQGHKPVPNSGHSAIVEIDNSPHHVPSGTSQDTSHHEGSHTTVQTSAHDGVTQVITTTIPESHTSLEPSHATTLPLISHESETTHPPQPVTTIKDETTQNAAITTIGSVSEFSSSITSIHDISTQPATTTGPTSVSTPPPTIAETRTAQSSTLADSNTHNDVTSAPTSSVSDTIATQSVTVTNSVITSETVILTTTANPATQPDVQYPSTTPSLTVTSTGHDDSKTNISSQTENPTTTEATTSVPTTEPSHTPHQESSEPSRTVGTHGRSDPAVTEASQHLTDVPINATVHSSSSHSSDTTEVSSSLGSDNGSTSTNSVSSSEHATTFASFSNGTTTISSQTTQSTMESEQTTHLEIGSSSHSANHSDATEGPTSHTTTSEQETGTPSGLPTDGNQFTPSLNHSENPLEKVSPENGESTHHSEIPDADKTTVFSTSGADGDVNHTSENALTTTAIPGITSDTHLQSVTDMKSTTATEESESEEDVSPKPSSTRKPELTTTSSEEDDDDVTTIQTTTSSPDIEKFPMRGKKSVHNSIIKSDKIKNGLSALETSGEDNEEEVKAVTKDDGKASAIREVGPQSVDAMKQSIWMQVLAKNSGTSGT